MIVKARYYGPTVVLGLDNGKEYKIERILDGLLEIIDEEGVKSLWPPDLFVFTQGNMENLDEYETVD